MHRNICKYIAHIYVKEGVSRLELKIASGHRLKRGWIGMAASRSNLLDDAETHQNRTRQIAS